MIPSPFFPPIITSSGPLSTHAAWPCLLAGQLTERVTELLANLLQYCAMNKKESYRYIVRTPKTYYMHVDVKTAAILSYLNKIINREKQV